LCSDGLNHSKLSHVHVFDVCLAGYAKRLSSFLILGFRAGALRHPAGEFPLRHAPSEQVAHHIEHRLSLEAVGLAKRSHGIGGGTGVEHESVNAKGRGELEGERAQQLGRMRKRNCCTRGESLFKEDSPAHAPRRRRKSCPTRTKATQPLTRGPRPTSHTAGVWVSEC
jgi:hypothetical protein